MNWTTIFQYAPKLALALLIIIGVLIVVEIVNMIREKQSKPKEADASTRPENLQPIKFYEQPALDTASLPMPHSRMKPFVPIVLPRTEPFVPIVLLSILTIAIIAITVFKRQSEEQPAQPIETPTPESTPTEWQPTIVSPIPLASPNVTLISPPEALPSSIVAPPIIKVYQIDQKKAWVQLTDDDLARLKPNDEIFIAIATAKTYTKALFKINGEEILYVKDKQLTPNQEGYIRYTLPATESKITIEVILLNE